MPFFTRDYCVRRRRRRRRRRTPPPGRRRRRRQRVRARFLEHRRIGNRARASSCCTSATREARPAEKEAQPPSGAGAGNLAPRRDTWGKARAAPIYCLCPETAGLAPNGSRAPAIGRDASRPSTRPRPARAPTSPPSASTRQLRLVSKGCRHPGEAPLALPRPPLPVALTVDTPARHTWTRAQPSYASPPTPPRRPRRAAEAVPSTSLPRDTPGTPH